MPQQKDIFDLAPEIDLSGPKPSPPPAQSPVRQNMQALFPAAYQAAHQMAQVPQGLMDIGRALSPVDFSQGWGSPQLQVPPAAQSLMESAAYPERTLNSLAGWLGTVGREAGALVAPNQIQAPSQPEMDQATRSASATGIPLVLGAAFPEVQTAATKAGIPQKMIKMGTASDEAVLPQLIQHPVATVAKGAAGPLLRFAGRALTDPMALPRPEPPVPQEYIPPEGMTHTASSADAIDVPYRPAAEAPKPPKMLKSYEQPKLQGGSEQKALPAPASTQPLFQGQEGGLGPKPHADVVAQRPMLVRTIKGDGSGGVPGQFRLETVNEMKARLQNFGRGLTKQPTADAQPYTPPKPPPKPKGATTK